MILTPIVEPKKPDVKKFDPITLGIAILDVTKVEPPLNVYKDDMVIDVEKPMYILT